MPNSPFAAAVLALAVALPVVAADADNRDLEMVSPATVGLSAAGLDRLGAAMQRFVNDGDLSGAVTAVARHGKVAHFEAFGKQDIAADVPMAKDTIFRIYSMTKPIVGVALMTFSTPADLLWTIP